MLLCYSSATWWCVDEHAEGQRVSTEFNTTSVRYEIHYSLPGKGPGHSVGVKGKMISSKHLTGIAI